MISDTGGLEAQECIEVHKREEGFNVDVVDVVVSGGPFVQRAACRDYA
jgi:hypothetical protein